MSMASWRPLGGVAQFAARFRGSAASRASCIVRCIGSCIAGDAAAWPARLRCARVSVVVSFAILGMVEGLWLARIPAVKHALHLSDGLLGVSLLAAPAGLVLVVLLAGRLVDAFGSSRLTRQSGVAVALLPIGLGLAGNMALLMIALLAFGIAAGLLDVAMNAQAGEVERGSGRPLMSSFHACYSFGGLAGALTGGLFAWAGVGPLAMFLVAGPPLAAVAAITGRWLLPGPAEPPGPSRPEAAGQPEPLASLRNTGPAAAPGQSRVARRLLALGLLALCCMLGEGAAGSWSAVYLRDNLGTSAGFAAIGFAAFSITMAFGRLFGDRLAARFGPAALLRGCGLVAALGLGAGLIIATPVAGVAGFALLGAGLSCTIPQLFSAAGNADPARRGAGLARVAGLGYLGLLGGPVVIGGCASLVGLPRALGIPVVLSLLVAASAGVLGRTGISQPRPRR
jgi:MFS family permease